MEVGYAGTTVRAVAERAGVSAGAQTYHFPYRVDLVTAALEHVAERRFAEIRRIAGQLPPGREERLRAVLDLLWADLSSPLFAAVVKLWVAAADDRELLARLEPIERELRRSLRDLGRDVLGDLARSPELLARFRVAVDAIRGLALTRAFEPGGSSRRGDPWPAHRAELERMLLA